MKSYLLAMIIAGIFTILSGLVVIPVLRKVKVGQPILKYVENHKEKSGTPTMGGLFFILPACLTFIIFGGIKGRLAVVSLSIGLAYMCVGFLDDFIKIKTHKNEGLKPYQKIIFQTSIAIFSGFFAYYNGLTVFYLPFSLKSIDVGVFVIPIVSFVFIAITNSVNLTDGLDGLSGTVSFTYLLFIAILTILEMQTFSSRYLNPLEYERVLILTFSLIGAIIGFLIFNVNKASVFMGDTGSLSLGGFIGSISIFTANSFFIPIIGIMFVMSSISVIVQVAYYKKTKKRVFLMAPLHHHFQMKGVSEAKISFWYFAITFTMGCLSLIAFV